MISLLLQQVISGQPAIRGRVVAAGTGTAIPGCSVFITGTSRGTSTDAAGNFELTGLPPGKHELVVSSVGYETSVYPFTDAQLPLHIRVELTIRVKEMANITLEPSTEEGWDKWGKMFMENFVGTTANAASCRIKNEQAIRFRYYKKSNRVIAYCDEPVLLENKALGYEVSYQLENFEVNFREGTVFYLGYSLFKPMETGGQAKQNSRNRKRREAYYGSIFHFMRSIYTNRLQEEGFDVYRMRREMNTEKQRVKQVYRAQRQLISGNGRDISVLTQGSGQGHHPDSVGYYNRVLHQPDNFERYDTVKLNADSLLAAVSGEIKSISFGDYLFITYRNEKEDPEYVRLQFPVRKAGLQRSYVFLAGDQVIAIDMNGNYFNPQDFITSGYWGWSEKMANTVPVDYEPDNE